VGAPWRKGAGANSRHAGNSEFTKAADKGRFLAKRFAAKEAFSKALGTGVRPPATLSAIAVLHDHLGKPMLVFSPALHALLEEKT
jgi:holo-[acyl-carrier protein] synthase